MKRHRSKQRRQIRRHDLFSRFRRFMSNFLLIIFVVTFAVPLFAAEEPAVVKPAEVAAQPEEASPTPVAAEPAKPAAEAAGEKLAEGVGETATGWTEAPKEIVETSKETNPIEGVTVGTVRGAGEAVVKTTEGAVKTATFYIPSEKPKKAEEVNK